MQLGLLSNKLKGLAKSKKCPASPGSFTGQPLTLYLPVKTREHKQIGYACPFQIVDVVIQ